METADYTLYLVTDRNLMSCDTVEESVRQAAEGGVTVVQLREKQSTSREFYEQAVRVKVITDAYGIPLIINDRVDIAMAVDAAGVHLGQKDMPCSIARRILGPDKIIGVSAALPAEALQAKADGASYLGVGAVFQTGTKQDTRPVTKERLAQIRAAVDLPIVIIGGVKQSNVLEFAGMGINGAAVVSAIVAQPDIKKAAEEMRRILQKF